MHSFDTLRRGLLAGILASLVLALLYFVTDGAPGNGFPSVLHWFGLTLADPLLSRWVGFLLLLVLGGIFGLIFGAIQQGRSITTVRALLNGLALGVLWWLLLNVMLNNVTNHAPTPFNITFGYFISSFLPALLFGVLLAAIYIQWKEQRGLSQPS